jgi:S-methylmethionine-dependent homocysteine/selenocysteine methylase
MITGFLLLIVFVAVALQASTTAGSVVAGGLGAVSAALSGFVARTFVKSQETAAAHLRAYFDQPLEFSRYLAAERLIADSALTEEQRAEALTTLVQAMVTLPAPVAPGQLPGMPGQAGQQ